MPTAGEIDPVIGLLAKEGAEYLASLDDRPVRDAAAESVAARFDVPLPERGEGAEEAIRELLGGLDGALQTSGTALVPLHHGRHDPRRARRRLAHPVLDQNPGAWVASPLAAQLELMVLRWLRGSSGYRRRGAGC